MPADVAEAAGKAVADVVRANVARDCDVDETVAPLPVAPMEVDETVVPLTDAPVSAPVAPVAAPVAPVGAPVAPVAAPVAPVAAPVAPVAAPAAPVGAPVAAQPPVPPARPAEPPAPTAAKECAHAPFAAVAVSTTATADGRVRVVLRVADSAPAEAMDVDACAEAPRADSAEPRRVLPPFSEVVHDALDHLLPQAAALVPDQSAAAAMAVLGARAGDQPLPPTAQC